MEADSLTVFERYDAWNEGIKRELFSGQWAAQPVYLDLEENVLERIAGASPDAGDRAEDLAAAVRPTIPPNSAGLLLSRHHARLRGWRAGGCEGTPPFLALL